MAALRLPEMCFWPAKTSRNLDLFEMHTCLWLGAQMWFRHKWRKLVAASHSLHCIGGYSCLRYWNEFFSAVFHVLDWTFLVLRFHRNVCNWILKVIWPRKDWFCGFLLKTDFFRWLVMCMDWNLQEMFNCYSFFTTSIFLIFSLRGILVCSLKKVVLFSHRICNIDW